MIACQLTLLGSFLMGIDINVLLRQVIVMEVTPRLGVVTNVHARAGVSLPVAHGFTIPMVTIGMQ